MNEEEKSLREPVLTTHVEEGGHAYEASGYHLPWKKYRDKESNQKIAIPCQVQHMYCSGNGGTATLAVALAVISRVCQ